MAAVLFICTGNMYRSPIAAGVLRGLLARDERRKDWQVGSAGTWTTEGRPAPKDAVEIARSLGVDLGAHQTRMVNKKIMEDHDLIIVMEEGHKEALRVEFPFAGAKIRMLSNVLQGVDYDVADPAAARGEARVILQEVADMVRAAYDKICRLVE